MSSAYVVLVSLTLPTEGLKRERLGHQGRGSPFSTVYGGTSELP